MNIRLLLLVLFYTTTIDNNLANIYGDDRVKLTVYYEALCKDSFKFVNGPLKSAFSSVKEIVNLVLIPFGKAYYWKTNASPLWQFECQNGPNECYGNRVHNCFINFYPKAEDHLEFISCTLNNWERTYGPKTPIDIERATQQCHKQSYYDINKLFECANGPTGNNLLYKMGTLTHSLRPALNYIPWITINDVYNEQTQREAEFGDITKLICENYRGHKNVPACYRYKAWQSSTRTTKVFTRPASYHTDYYRQFWQTSTQRAFPVTTKYPSRKLIRFSPSSTRSTQYIYPFRNDYNNYNKP